MPSDRMRAAALPAHLSSLWMTYAGIAMRIVLCLPSGLSTRISLRAFGGLGLVYSALGRSPDGCHPDSSFSASTLARSGVTSPLIIRIASVGLYTFWYHSFTSSSVIDLRLSGVVLRPSGESPYTACVISRDATFG